MMKQKLTIILITFLMLLTQIKAEENNLKDLSLHSPNYILYSINDDEVIVSKNNDIKLSAASINKVLTTITAIDELEGTDLDSKITVYPKSLHYIEREASRAGLKANQEVSLREVLYSIILPSGADAVALMSMHLYESEDGMVEAMNKKAKEIGMINTNITNPVGLDDSNQYTTLDDLLTLLKYALKNDDFRDVYTKKDYTIVNEDLLIENQILVMASQSNFNHILGAKSGYTTDAGRSLSSLGKVDGKEYIFISTGAEGSATYSNEAYDDAVSVYNSLSSGNSNVSSSPKTNSITNILTNLFQYVVIVLIIAVIILYSIRTYNIKRNKKRDKIYRR